MPAGDDVAVDGAFEHFRPLGDGELPEGRPPLGQRVAAPHVVHQHVEPPLLVTDTGEKAFDLGFDGVVRPNGDAAAAAAGDQLRCLFDRFGPSRRRRAPAYAAAGAIHGGAGRPQHAGDAAAGPARGPGDDGDMVQ